MVELEEPSHRSLFVRGSSRLPETARATAIDTGGQGDGHLGILGVDCFRARGHDRLDGAPMQPRGLGLSRVAPRHLQRLRTT